MSDRQVRRARIALRTAGLIDCKSRKVGGRKVTLMRATPFAEIGESPGAPPKSADPAAEVGGLGTPKSANAPSIQRSKDRREEQTPLLDQVEEVFLAWVTATGKSSRTVLDNRRRALISRGLVAYPVDDLLDSVRGWRHSAYHRGENATGTAYNDLSLLLRDSAHIEQFRDLARKTPEPTRGDGTLAFRPPDPNSGWDTQTAAFKEEEL